MCLGGRRRGSKDDLGQLGLVLAVNFLCPQRSANHRMGGACRPAGCRLVRLKGAG